MPEIAQPPKQDENHTGSLSGIRLSMLRRLRARGERNRKMQTSFSNIDRRISLNDVGSGSTWCPGCVLKLGRNFFHGDVRNQCFPESVCNVDTRRTTQLCSPELCNAGFAKKERAVLNLFSVLTHANSHKFAVLFLAAAGSRDASCS